MRRCIKCQKEKSEESFYASCKTICKTCKCAYQAELVAKNPEAKRKYNAQYRGTNKEHLNKKRREWGQKNTRHFYNYHNAYRKERRRNEPLYAAYCDLRGRIRSLLTNGRKSESSKKLLGCSVEQLKNYLESKFLPGMSWENRGLKGWHIDHIRPVASFDLSQPEEIARCFHYTNLQPLWAIDNLKKSDSINLS